MREEKSCGALVFRGDPKSPEVLLLKHRAGHWDFPKGHVEPGETEQETALREVLEESGLQVHIPDASFKRVIRYSPEEGTMKNVIFFIAFYASGELRPQPSEISRAVWLAPEAAVNLLTYQSSRVLLEEALYHLNEGGDFSFSS